MKAVISTVLPATSAELLDRISRPAYLIHVCSPLLDFRPYGGTVLDREWAVDKEYALKLYFRGFLPLGRHHITLKRFDKAAHVIVSSESGLLARTWNHTITFHDVPGGVQYTDEIEIRAGVLTLFIWLFAHVFYRHRQRRWKEVFIKKIEL